MARPTAPTEIGDRLDREAERVRETTALLTGQRPLTLAQAQATFDQRFTLDHVPAWAAYPLRRSMAGEAVDYPAPQYRSDAEWYALTTYPGEGGLSAQSSWCISHSPTWPLGERLPQPYRAVPRGTPTPNPNRKPVTRDGGGR